MIRAATVGLLGLVLLGCSGVELSPVNTAGVDFSGEWLIDFGASDQVPDLRNRAPRKQKRRLNPTVRDEALRIGDGSGLAFVTHDFQVLHADKLQIEQNRDSMGIRYFPGVYRDVTWGTRQRGLWEVYAGWEEQELVIISEAKDLKVSERFARVATDVLVVNVSVDADGEEMDIKRTFRRRR